MDEARFKTWETLFRWALELMDSVVGPAKPLTEWSFGGGTVLMRRHRHRFSKDIDIFIDDPQYISFLSPRLNRTAEELTNHYIEQQGFLKLIIPEGEIDFVVSGPLIKDPFRIERLMGRDVRVETSAEIVAKKAWHRGVDFTARDLFDLAMVAEKEPEAIDSIKPILQERRRMILDRIAGHEAALRETFAALEVLDYRRNFDECIEIAKAAME
ncbi:MAG TPA: nucleotidyl transferase AbiEii/AbiGii toxin family protein [Dehalococcoidia bacterium]|nr:nucleotidyl transferase AbiEii/AbiGii toxin family protein [Dehalococcoidia bacterium]